MATPLDAWLYYLCNAESLDLAALPKSLQLSPVRRALEELNMIRESDIDRERYEARVKLQRDTISRELALRLDYEESLKKYEESLKKHEESLKKAVHESRQEGIETGVSLGRSAKTIDMIHFCQKLLSQSPTPSAELQKLPIDKLERLCTQLEQQVSEQRDKSP